MSLLLKNCMGPMCYKFPDGSWKYFCSWKCRHAYEDEAKKKWKDFRP